MIVVNGNLSWKAAIIRDEKFETFVRISKIESNLLNEMITVNLKREN